MLNYPKLSLKIIVRCRQAALQKMNLEINTDRFQFQKTKEADQAF